MKANEMNMKKKILIIVIILALGITGYLSYSYIVFKDNNARFGQNLDFNAETGDYTRVTDGEVYYYSPNPWWQFGGNMGITSKKTTGEDGQASNEYYNIQISISRNAYTANVSLGYKDEDGNIRDVRYCLNEKMEFVNPEDVSSVQEMLFDSMKPRILEVYKKVYDTWGIFSPDEVDT